MSEFGDFGEIFAEEATELLGQLSRLFLELEKGAPGDREKRIRELFRVAHTLKGASATIGRDDFAEVAHALESKLDAVRQGTLAPHRPLIDAALAAADVLSSGVRTRLEPEQIQRAVAALEQATSGTTATRIEEPPRAAEPVTQISEASEPAPKPRRRRKADRPEGFQEVLKELGVRLGEIAGGTAPEHGTRSLLEFVDRLAKSAGSGGTDFSARLLAALRAALERHRDEPTPPRTLLDACFMAADLMLSDQQGTASPEEVEAIERLLTSAPPEKPKPAGEQTTTTATAPEAYLRIPVSVLDSILYRLDELVAARLRADHQRRQIEELQESLELAWTRSRSDPQALVAHLEGHRRGLEQVHRGLSRDVHELGLAVQGLYEDVKEVRMVPVGPSLDPLRRMVRDLARSLGKEATLEVVGEHVRLDKRLLDLIRDPLTHLLRNAVDHGLEAPAERREAGKPERGEVRITVEARDAQVWVEIADDGRGISVERVREVAQARGIIDPGQVLTDREILNCIFTPGFSTASKVTEVSGRGVGLDVVRENVGRLGGRIEFFTEAGKGSQFKLALPLTLATSYGLLVQSGKQTFCIPIGAVEEVVELDPKQVGLAQGRWVIPWRKQTVSYTGLDELLAGRPSTRPSKPFPAMILALSERRLALGVDQLLGHQEVVVKGCAPGTPPLPFVAGATSLGDGQLVTVLEPAALIAEAAGTTAQAPLAERPRATVLVVDDSLTSRRLVASVLERAGHKTLLARDGQDALSVLSRERVDLVVSDVEMPNLDGLGLTRRIRQVAAWANLPVILLTSLDSPDDRARGAEAGATAYLVKKDFDPLALMNLAAPYLSKGSGP